MVDAYEISVLAEDYETKRQIFENHAMTNTPVDAEKRRLSMIAYHIAEAEMLEAWRRLERAKHGLRG